jgi:hypothetical protein
MTDFVNLKIKQIQSFGVAYRGRICVHIFIGVSVHTYISMCVYTVFLKKVCLSRLTCMNWDDFAINKAKGK